MSEPVLALKNIVKTFGAFKATDDVSLELFPGEIHALIGPNGAGKSTLIGQISGSLRPNSGQVYLNGRDISALSVAKRARLGLGRSFQVSSLALEYSARRNVMLAIQARRGSVYRFWQPVSKDLDAIQQAQSILEKVGLGDRSRIVVSEMSHGEKRQLEVACALALKPVCFLLDEPMAGLGPEGSEKLIGFLDQLRSEAPILLIEHDMDAVFRLADRISVLVYGRIIMTGSAKEIASSKEVQTAYLGSEPAC